MCTRETIDFVGGPAHASVTGTPEAGLDSGLWRTVRRAIKASRQSGAAKAVGPFSCWRFEIAKSFKSPSRSNRQVLKMEATARRAATLALAMLLSP